MAEEEGAPAAEEKPAAPSGNPLLLIIVLLNTVLMGAVAYLQKTSHDMKKNEEPIEDVIMAQMKKIEAEKEAVPDTGEGKQEEGILLALEGFTANLAQGDGPRRFIRLSIVLKFSSNSNEEEFKSRKPQIRDTIISILNSKRPEDLLKIEGKNFLKEEVKAGINSFLVDGSIIDVYYVGFQIN